MSALVRSKLQTIPRFRGIKQMWLGADYSLTNKWQWRGYYKAFTGLAYLLNTSCQSNYCKSMLGYLWMHLKTFRRKWKVLKSWTDTTESTER